MPGGRRWSEPLAAGAALLLLWSALLAATWKVTLAPGWVGPWSSDAWGHIAKAEYLSQAWEEGFLFPSVQPQWYLGQELFRYYAPVPYYLLALLLAAVGDPARAAGWYVFLALGFGSSTFLLFRQQLGLFPSFLGGLIFAFYHDHWRVAFAEGNLPRLTVVALLPLAAWLAYRLLAAQARERGWLLLGLSLLVSLMVLCHAMAAAIAMIMLLAFGVICALWAGASGRGLTCLLIALALGLAWSAWWLVPSLQGGITSLNAGAMSEAVASFPPIHALNPALRLRDPETFYLGLSFVVGLLALLLWGRMRSFERGAVVAGLMAGTMPLTPVRALWSALPGSHLLWPIRFASLAGTFLPLGLAAILQDLKGSRRHLFAGVLLAALAVDLSGTVPLAHPQDPPLWLEEVAAGMAARPGWREATLDLSRLGSKPTRFLSAEQVYGWAYQGAPNARALATLNEALASGLGVYVADRLDEMGVDDVLWLEEAPADPAVRHRLEAAGFVVLSRDGDRFWLHRDGPGPRVFQVAYPVLGIGAGAYNAVALWPQIAAGGVRPLDDYRLEELLGFRTLYLSRCTWRDRTQAENLVRAYAEQGGTVVVDLTGSPADLWARVPRFLGVYAEPVWLEGPQTLLGPAGQVRLAAFPPQEDGPWLAHTPQGANLEPVWTFPYLGGQVTAIGRLKFGQGTVWFVGMNLPWHARVTGDPASRDLMGSLLDLRPGQVPGRRAIPVADYQAGPAGYRLRLEDSPGGWVLVPVSWRDDLKVRWNGVDVEAMPMNDLIWTQLPPGEGWLEIGSRQPPGRTLGALIGGGGLVLALAWVGRRAFSWRAAGALLLAVAWVCVGFPPQPAHAAGPIVLDGQFGDWQGQAHIDDPVGDGHIPSTDIQRFYWAAVPGDDYAYFMFEKAPEHPPRGVLYLLWIDTNNDGQYGTPQDRVVTVLYRARNDNSQVAVAVLTGNGQPVANYAGDWGDSRAEGGTRCEFGVSFGDLGIGSGQALRMFLTSAPGGQGNMISDRAPDAGDVQWSPVDALGYGLLALVLGGGVLLLTWTRRQRARRVPARARHNGGRGR